MRENTSFSVYKIKFKFNWSVSMSHPDVFFIALVQTKKSQNYVLFSNKKKKKVQAEI